MATSSNISRSTSHLTGYFLNVFLHGMLSIQTWEYYLDYPKDLFVLKLTVHGLFAIETAQTALVVYLAFMDLALKSETSFNVFGVSGVILGSIVASIVQTFHAYRITSLSSRKRWFAGLIVMLASVQLGMGILIGVTVLKDNDEPEKALLPYNIHVRLAWFGVAALCNILITVVMAVLLIQNDGGLVTARHLMKRVLRLITGTGIITTSASILCFILVAGTHGQFYFVAILQSLPKLYSNTLLVQLNSRPKPCDVDLGLLENLDISFVKNDGHVCPDFGSGSLESQFAVSKDDDPLPERSQAEEDSPTLLA